MNLNTTHFCLWSNSVLLMWSLSQIWCIILSIDGLWLILLDGYCRLMPLTIKSWIKQPKTAFIDTLQRCKALKMPTVCLLHVDDLFARSVILNTGLDSSLPLTWWPELSNGVKLITCLIKSLNKIFLLSKRSLSADLLGHILIALIWCTYVEIVQSNILTQFWDLAFKHLDFVDVVIDGDFLDGGGSDWWVRFGWLQSYLLPLDGWWILSVDFSLYWLQNKVRLH